MSSPSHNDVTRQARPAANPTDAEPRARERTEPRGTLPGEPPPAELSDTLRRYMQIVDTSSDVLGVIDRDYRYTVVNRQFCRYYGTTVSEAIGAHVAEYMGHKIFDRLIKARIDASFAGDTFKLDGIVRYPAAGERYMSIDSRPLYGADGEIEGCVFSALDITEQRNAELAREAIAERTQAMQRLEALGELAGGIAHEFNNLLTPILGYASLARQRLGDLGGTATRETITQASVTLRRDLEEIGHAGERARELVGHLLSYARGDQANEKESVDIAGALGRTTRLLSPLQGRDLTLSLEVDGHLAPIVCSPVNFEQTVMNLCLNARDAMNGKGKIWLRAAARSSVKDTCTSCGQTFEGSYNEITVEDTGPGFEPGHLNRAFEPFFTTKAPGQGTGLGLAFVHGTVHGCGGHIVAHNTPGGCAIRLLVPIEESASSSTKPESEREGARIVVVDDDPMAGAILAEFLIAGGHHPRVFEHPRAAMQALTGQVGDIDLVIVDQRMPSIEGDQLIEAFRAEAPALPAILCTGRSDMESVVDRLGDRTALLPKPISETRLYELVATLTGKASVQQPVRPPS